MGDNNFEDDNQGGRASPSSHHLGHHHGLESVPGDDGDTMETDHHTLRGGPGELIMHTHSSLDGEPDDEDDDDLSGGGGGGKKKDKPQGKIKKKAGGSGRRRIEIKFIENKSRRQVTFSRRKRGLMKKAYELTTLTGTQALVLIASETGHVYTFATPKLQPVVTLREGKELIQSCLNAPDNNYPNNQEFMGNSGGGGGGSGGGGSGGNSPQSVHQAPKSEPHNSPQLPQQPPLPLHHQQHQHLGHQHPQMQPQHAQHAQHPGHHDPMLSGLPYGHPHGSYPHMGGGGYPHDMSSYLSQSQSLPPMSLPQHMSHPHDPKGRDHGL